MLVATKYSKHIFIVYIIIYRKKLQKERSDNFTTISLCSEIQFLELLPILLQVATWIPPETLIKHTFANNCMATRIEYDWRILLVTRFAHRRIWHINGRLRSLRWGRRRRSGSGRLQEVLSKRFSKILVFFCAMCDKIWETRSYTMHTCKLFLH